MDAKRKELNHVINMMYRQLGKDLHDDLEVGKVNIKKYKSVSKKIDNVKKAIRLLEIEMDGLEAEDEDMKVIKGPEQDAEGLYLYKFCPHCNAGNNPEATHCIRCHEPV